MEFDKSKVYTALNAEELKVGSEVIVAYDLDSLKYQVEANSWPTYVKKLDEVLGPDHIHRFKLPDSRAYNLAYLVRKVGEVKQEEEKWVVYLAKEQDFSWHLDYCAESFWAWGCAKPKLFVGTHDEAKEWCQSRQKFLKVIKAWEDGKQIQYWDKQRGCWFNVNEPSWNQDKEYRVKPEEEKWIAYLARYQDGLTLCCSAKSYWENAKKFDGAKRKLFVGSEDEAKEWCRSHQKFAEAIEAFEDGKMIQYYYDPDEEWVDVEAIPAWNVSTKYRVKPKEKFNKKVLKCTDLNVGDIIKKGNETRLVINVDRTESNRNRIPNINAGNYWMDDMELEKWEKVE